jgi:hypothetical protein
MARREFTKAIKRATRNGQVYCEECHALAKTWDIDHVNPDGLTGKPTLENARVLCRPCHTEKTASDVEAIARAKRVEAKHARAIVPAAPIKSAPMPTTERAAKRQTKPAVVDRGSLFARFGQT